MPDRTITQRNARYRRRLAQHGLRRIEVFVPEDRIPELKAFARSLRTTSRPNPELINDRAKLLYHRLVARRLRHEPALISRAKDVIARQPFSSSGPHVVEVWRRLLNGPTDLLMRELVGRSAEARRLRLSSPFPFVDELKIDDEQLRRRFWRVAKRVFVRAMT
jgi:hypothetical protein